jgi:hypothetical protein
MQDTRGGDAVMYVNAAAVLCVNGGAVLPTQRQPSRLAGVFDDRF